MLKYVFSPTKSQNFNFFKILLLRYFCKTILLVLPYSFYDLKWPIYSCFLIEECTFSIISPVTSGIFNLFKHMSLRYGFQTILMVVPDSCYNVKSPPYAPVFYVQNIKMYIYSFTRSKNFNFFQYQYFFEASAIQIYATIQNGHCKRFIFENHKIFKGGIMCDHLYS